jgi:AraC family transcriptional regulator of adaptative response/methylated-DNA-[protein]-cysteine methyltransferase
VPVIGDRNEDTHVARVVEASRLMLTQGGPIPAATLAADVGCSVRQLSRSFEQVLGITPREFGKAVRTDHARSMLQSNRTVTDAIFAAGFESVRGFYESVPPTLGMSPTAYRRGGEDELLRWATTSTSIGRIILVASDRGLAAVRIGDEDDALLVEVRREFPNATFVPDPAGLHDALAAVVAISQGGKPTTPVPVDLRGTAFQAKVWESLRRIPPGETRSYADVARDIGEPSAARAVGSACGANPVALVVPCHRVVRADGGLGGYRWGLAVKQELLDIERNN